MKYFKPYFEESPNLKKIAYKIIEAREELYHILEFGIDIGFLFSDEEKMQGGKRVLGECRKVSGVLSHYCPYDFLIILYEPNITDFTDAQIQVLLYHELLHIGYDGKIAPHDIEDFAQVLIEHGLSWQRNENLKPIVPVVGGDEYD